MKKVENKERVRKEYIEIYDLEEIKELNNNYCFYNEILNASKIMILKYHYESKQGETFNDFVMRYVDKILSKVLKKYEGNENEKQMKRKIKIFKTYYSNENLTLQTVGEKFNLTREPVRRIVDFIGRVIRKYIINEN